MDHKIVHIMPLHLVDVEEEENNYIKKHFNDRAKLVYKKARLNIKNIKLISSAIKWCYGCNNYGERDKTMNAGVSSDECSRCNEIGTWEHLVHCRNKVSIRVEFILHV